MYHGIDAVDEVIDVLTSSNSTGVAGDGMHPATPAAFLALMALALFACCLRYCRRPRSIERQTMIGRDAARSDGRPRRATPPRRAHRLAGSGTGSGSSKQLFDTAFESALRSGGLGGWPKPLRIAQQEGQHQLQEQLQDRGSFDSFGEDGGGDETPRTAPHAAGAGAALRLEHRSGGRRRGGADDHALIEISPYDNTSGVGVHRSDSVESRLSDEASSSVCPHRHYSFITMILCGDD